LLLLLVQVASVWLDLDEVRWLLSRWDKCHAIDVELSGATWDLALVAAIWDFIELELSREANVASPLLTFEGV